MSVHKHPVPWISHGVWRCVVDRSHRKVGVALARQWNLPPEISQAIDRCAAFDSLHPHDYANLVCLANAFAKRQGLYAGDVDNQQVGELVSEGQRLLALSDEAMSALGAGLYGRVGTLFEVKIPTAQAAS